jgi:hypothetical protein
LPGDDFNLAWSVEHAKENAMSNRMREVSLASVLFLAYWTAQVYAEAGAQYDQPEVNAGRIEGHDGRQHANTYRGGITRIDITQSRVAYNGLSFGDVGAYQLLTGIAYGTIDPKSPLNKDLVLLDKAPRNADGLVPYSMDVGILRPLDPGKGEKIMY